MRLGGTSPEYDRLFGQQEVTRIPAENPFPDVFSQKVRRSALIDALEVMREEIIRRIQYTPVGRVKQLERDYLQLYRTTKQIFKLKMEGLK